MSLIYKKWNGLTRGLMKGFSSLSEKMVGLFGWNQLIAGEG
jgi:hypothetical protein